jgi:hypothetical protein
MILPYDNAVRGNTTLPARAAADFPKKSRRFKDDESLIIAPFEIEMNV